MIKAMLGYMPLRGVLSFSKEISREEIMKLLEELNEGA